MNVAFFGDSLGGGVILDEVNNKYKRLENSFAKMAGSALGLSILNFSKFGCTVVKGFEIVRAKAEQIASSRYTVLEFGGNDCDHLWGEIAENPMAEHPPKTELNEFKRIYGEMIAFIRELGSRPVLLNLPPIEPQRYFSWFSRGLKAENILGWLGGDVHYIYRWHELYSEAVERVARAFSAPLIDIRSEFLKRSDCASLLCTDGIHPNAAGHELIAAAIEKEVRSLGENLV
ncbi:MAG: SGNH/GDSL hydrolase family protein [Oscillospiraceae bacterium]|nr:SGNH/GDSL hydrolase family protein [Oscillospiraceae bacterium]